MSPHNQGTKYVQLITLQSSPTTCLLLQMSLIILELLPWTASCLGLVIELEPDALGNRTEHILFAHNQ